MDHLGNKAAEQGRRPDRTINLLSFAFGSNERRPDHEHRHKSWHSRVYGTYMDPIKLPYLSIMAQAPAAPPFPRPHPCLPLYHRWLRRDVEGVEAAVLSEAAGRLRAAQAVVPDIQLPCLRNFCAHHRTTENQHPNDAHEYDAHPKIPCAKWARTNSAFASAATSFLFLIVNL
jgi:hypothetical protein